jgi:hypothetical protein
VRATVPLLLLIGEGDLAEETRQALDAAGAEVHRLKGAAEREVRHALDGGGVDKVVVVSRDDAAALRVALMVRYVDGDVPMLVTIFDPTMAGQVATEIEHCEVTSMADIVAPSLAGPCLGEHLTAVHAEGEGEPVGLRETEDGVERVPVEVPPRRRVRALLTALLRPYDKSGARCCSSAPSASSWRSCSRRRARCSSCTRDSSMRPTARRRRS